MSLGFIYGKLEYVFHSPQEIKGRFTNSSKMIDEVIDSLFTGAALYLSVRALRGRNFRWGVFPEENPLNYALMKGLLPSLQTVAIGVIFQPTVGSLLGVGAMFMEPVEVLTGHYYPKVKPLDSWGVVSSLLVSCPIFAVKGVSVVSDQYKDNDPTLNQTVQKVIRVVKIITVVAAAGMIIVPKLRG